MRLDYALYTLAAILFFVFASVPFVYKVDPKELWIISAVVLGIIFAGLGYSQRPKVQAKAVTAEAPPPPTPSMPVVQEPAVVEAEAVQETVEKPIVTMKGLTDVKGIGEKRAEQLKAVGINSVEDLAKASADDVAAKLKVSPKITKVWIENAKKLVEKS